MVTGTLFSGRCAAALSWRRIAAKEGLAGLRESHSGLKELPSARKRPCAPRCARFHQGKRGLPGAPWSAVLFGDCSGGCSRNNTVESVVLVGRDGVDELTLLRSGRCGVFGNTRPVWCGQGFRSFKRIGELGNGCERYHKPSGGDFNRGDLDGSVVTAWGGHVCEPISWVIAVAVPV